MSNLILISSKQFRKILVAYLVFLALSLAGGIFVGKTVERKQIYTQIEIGILSNKTTKIGKFTLFKDYKNQSYICTENFKEVADISITKGGKK